MGLSSSWIRRLDLLARTTTSFGPSFVERALTAGEGKVSVGATFSSTNYDKLSDFSLTNLPLGSVTSSSPIVSGTTTGNLKISSRRSRCPARVGVTPKIDIGVVVPLVTVKLSGTSAFVNGNGVVGRLVETNNVFSGLGDIAALAKFRIASVQGRPTFPIPAELAHQRGHASADRRSRQSSRSRCDAHAGIVCGVVWQGAAEAAWIRSSFEYWNKAVDVPGDHLKNQFQYNAGVEIVAAPKLTLLADFLGQRVLGAGPVELGLRLRRLRVLAPPRRSRWCLPMEV